VTRRAEVPGAVKFDDRDKVNQKSGKARRPGNTPITKPCLNFTSIFFASSYSHMDDDDDDIFARMRPCWIMARVLHTVQSCSSSAAASRRRLPAARGDSPCPRGENERKNASEKQDWERKIKGRNERRKERKKERKKERQKERKKSRQRKGTRRPPVPNSRPPPCRSPQPYPLLSTPFGRVLGPTSVERKKSRIGRVRRSSANRSVS
jgi:hypothetical protein